MTAKCPGNGPSVSKPGVAFTNAVGSGLITEGLTALSPYLLPFAILFDAFMYQAGSLCQTDPPPMPTFDSTDITNLIGGVLNPNFGTTAGKVNDLLSNYLWGQWCVCSDGTQYTPTPAPPPAGVGSNFVNQGSRCASVNWQGLVPIAPSPGNVSQHTPLTTITPAGPGSYLHITDSSGSYFAPPIPTGVSSGTYQVIQQPCPSCTGPECVTAILYFYDSAGAQVGRVDMPGAGPSIPVPGNAVYYYAIGAASGPPCNNGPLNLQLNVDWYCGGSGPGALNNCCPPDPSTATALNEIIQMVQQLANQLVIGNANLIPATIHHGLSGSGSVTLVNSCPAIRARVTSGLSGWPNNPGSPNYYFSLGFITSYENGSPLKGWRLVYNDQTFPLAAFADQIGYTLPPGVTIDIIELLAGP